MDRASILRFVVMCSAEKTLHSTVVRVIDFLPSGKSSLKSAPIEEQVKNADNSVAVKASSHDKSRLSERKVLIDLGVSRPNLISLSMLAKTEHRHQYDFAPGFWTISTLTRILLTENLRETDGVLY